MSDHLKTTFDVLARTRNESATPLLIAALDSPDPAIRQGAIGAILNRRSPAGQREILRRLHTLDLATRQMIESQRGCLGLALRDAVVRSDAATFVNACHEILRTQEFDLMPTLVAAMEDPNGSKGQLAAATVVALAELLHDELRSPNCSLRNPEQLRLRTTTCLGNSVRRYVRHQRREVVEAFLELADAQSEILSQILNDPHESCYLVVCEVLGKSQRPAVIELLLSYLDQPQAPHSALMILGRRSDAPFVTRLLDFLSLHQSEQIDRNLRRIEAIGWVQARPLLPDQLSDSAEQAALRMAMLSRLKRQQSYCLLVHLVRHGAIGARRAAAVALEHFTGAEANSLALQLLNDPDPQIQAAAVSQLRSRAIPGAVQRLIEKVNSPFPLVRDAARAALAEFNFERYLASFEGLDSEAQISTGRLVKTIDPRASRRLREELRSLARGRRLRALRMAEAMGLSEKVEDAIVDLLSDTDGFVRAEAARHLARVSTRSSRAALEIAALDPTPMVKEAAEQSLAELNLALERMSDPASASRSQEASLPPMESDEVRW